MSSQSFALRPPGMVLLPARYVRGTVLFALFSLLWFREHGPYDGDPSMLYAKALGGLRVIDVILLLVAAAHAWLYLGRSERPALPPRLHRPVLLFAAAIVVAMLYGASQGGQDLFFDWRAIFLGVLMTPVFAFWIRSNEGVRTAMSAFGVAMALRLGWVLIRYLLLGGGVDVVITGVRTPMFDGPTISAAVLLTIMSAQVLLARLPGMNRIVWAMYATLGMAFVLACFRRTYWGELAVAGFVLLLVMKRARLKVLILGSVVGTVALTLGGEMVLDRIRSFDFTSRDRTYAMTNLDHINDVLDAWDQVQRSPLTGTGLGRSYETYRITGWKMESVIVHNAILHVWVFYGVVGLVAYLWFHFRFWGWLKQCARELPQHSAGLAQVALAYSCAQFVMSAGFSPWAYAFVQTTITLAFLAGALFQQSVGRRND